MGRCGDIRRVIDVAHHTRSRDPIWPVTMAPRREGIVYRVPRNPSPPCPTRRQSAGGRGKPRESSWGYAPSSSSDPGRSGSAWLSRISPMRTRTLPRSFWVIRGHGPRFDPGWLRRWPRSRRRPVRGAASDQLPGRGILDCEDLTVPGGPQPPTDSTALHLVPSFTSFPSVMDRISPVSPLTLMVAPSGMRVMASRR